MRRRGATLIAVAVIITALVIVLVTLRNRPPEESAPTEGASAGERTTLYEIGRAEIARIVVQVGSERYALMQDGEEFAPVYPYDVAFVQSRVDRIVGAAERLSARRTIAEAPQEYAEYGLQEPQASLTIEQTNGDVTELMIGSQTPAQDSYYVRLADEPSVYAVYNTWITPLFYTLDQLRRKQVPQINTQEIVRIEIDNLRGRRLVARLADEEIDNLEASLSSYVVEQPFQRRYGLNSQLLEALGEQLPQIRILRYVDDAPSDLSEYGLNPPRARLYVADTERELQILFGEEVADGRYATFGFGQSVFVATGAEDLIETAAYSIVSSFALILNIDQVARFTVEAGDERYTASIEREWPESAEDDEEAEPIETFFLEGEEVDEDTFRDLYQWAIGLLFDAEAPQKPAYTNPAVTITYELVEGGSRSVEFVPYDTNFYAVFRDGVSEFLISRTKVTRMVDAYARVAETGSLE